MNLSELRLKHSESLGAQQPLIGRRLINGMIESRNLPDLRPWWEQRPWIQLSKLVSIGMFDRASNSLSMPQSNSVAENVRVPKRPLWLHLLGKSELKESGRRRGGADGGGGGEGEGNNMKKCVNRQRLIIVMIVLVTDEWRVNTQLRQKTKDTYGSITSHFGHRFYHLLL